MVYNGINLSDPLVTNTFNVMFLLFIPFIILIFLNRKEIVKPFKKINKKTWCILLIIFLLGFWLRNQSYRYGLNVDGIYYQEMAKSIEQKDVLSQGCSIGTVEKCDYYYGSVALPGYPFLIDIFFKIFGVHDVFAMFISGVLGSLSIILIFIVFFFLFKRIDGALFASLIYALNPLDIYISSTGAVRTSAIFFGLLSILFFLIALKNKKYLSWILAGVTFSLSIYFKIEMILLIIPFIFLLIIKRKNIKLKQLILFFGSFIIHQIFAISWLLNHSLGMTGGSQGTLKLLYIKAMIPILSKSLFSTITKKGIYMFNPFISFIFLSAIVYFLFRFRKIKNKENFIFVLIWFIIFFIGISSFYQCPGFPNVQCQEYRRYSQLLIPSYSIIAGFGLCLFNIKKYNKFLKLSFILLVSLPFLTLSPTLFKDNRTNENLVNDFYNISNELPDSLVITSSAQFFNFDFVQKKNFTIVSCNDNNLDEYLNYTKLFIDKIKSSDKDRIFFIDIGYCKKLYNFIDEKNINMTLIDNYDCCYYEINEPEEFKRIIVDFDPKKY